MKAEFYPRLALSGIRKNSRLYTPYILACTGMVMVQYIITYLASSAAIVQMRGGDVVRMVMSFGSLVIAVFSCLFLFYTNAFLIRRRKKEFGLYNVLGMGKGHIGVILLWESLIVAAVCLLGGLAAGVLLSKLTELVLVHLVGGAVSFTFRVDWPALKMTAIVFLIIFALLYCNALRQVRFSTALALLRSENAGEKPPKANWLLGLAGLFILGAAYYLAVTIEDPISALLVFFIAVLMVIAATFLLSISGSVLLCRVLQKNRRYYYRPDHFVSVSSMAYRMKRNGAGLASICILATMVLVMLSSTTCLYFGAEDAINGRYPRQINARFRLSDTELTGSQPAELRAQIDAVLDARGAQPENVCDYRYASVYGTLSGDTVTLIPDYANLSTLCGFQFMPLHDYNAMTGQSVVLDHGEALLYAFRTKYQPGSITFTDACTFRIAQQLDTFPCTPSSVMDTVPTIILIVPDPEQDLAPLHALTQDGEPLLDTRWDYLFDTQLGEEGQMALRADLLADLPDPGDVSYSYTIESRAQNGADFYGSFGGLFFLGILLSIVFSVAAVLILYYKQIVEGYEDQARFAIMQNIGMTHREIRRSINAQLLTVFYFPLLLAALHLAFAFPMIRKLLVLFGFENVPLFALTSAVSLLVFAALYALAYRITSNAYYAIVSTRDAV